MRDWWRKFGDRATNQFNKILANPSQAIIDTKQWFYKVKKMGGLRVKKADDKPATEEQVKKIVDNLKLTKNQAAFVREFAIDYHVESAAKRVGLSKTYCYRLMKRPEVLSALQAIQELHTAYHNITPQSLSGQMAIWSNSNIADYFDDNWNLKPPSQLTKAQASCIQSVQKTYNSDGMAQYKLTLVDKARSNENLAKAYDLYANSKLSSLRDKVIIMRYLTDLHTNGQIDQDELNQMVREINEI